MYTVYVTRYLNRSKRANDAHVETYKNIKYLSVKSGCLVLVDTDNDVTQIIAHSTWKEAVKEPVNVE